MAGPEGANVSNDLPDAVFRIEKPRHHSARNPIADVVQQIRVGTSVIEMSAREPGAKAAFGIITVARRTVRAESLGPRGNVSRRRAGIADLIPLLRRNRGGRNQEQQSAHQTLPSDSRRNYISLTPVAAAQSQYNADH